MAAHADGRHPSGQHRAQLEDTVVRRRERFSGWLRQIEVELGLTRAAPAATPVPVSSRPCRRPTPSST